jgi:hypothetical protein
MKTINEFFASENNVWVLSVVEMKSVKGGDEPPSDPDPFKKKHWGWYKNYH